jgi:hypothetical protein
MEKNIASHDLSDMMIYEGMKEQSERFHFKQRFAPILKIVEKGYQALELVGKFAKGLVHTPRKSVRTRQGEFVSTATAMYSILFASVVLSFFWLNLLTTM